LLDRAGLARLTAGLALPRAERMKKEVSRPKAFSARPIAAIEKVPGKRRGKLYSSVIDGVRTQRTLNWNSVSAVKAADEGSDGALSA